MNDTAHRAIAIVGVGAILPDAPNVPAFWNNVKSGRYSISEVPADRWDPARYYDADPSACDKSYSKIGGWVREFTWDPMKWRLPIPPRVADGMDLAQQWAVACTREALEDYGYPKRSLELDRTAVILGNAMAGEKHYLSSVRVFFPEYAHELEESASFAGLPKALQRDITREFHDRVGKRFAQITEDTMPGELANCMAGRIANLYNFHGPNYVCDAACASAMAAIKSAVEGLIEHDFDVAVTGGIDRNMGAPTFVKFCKIGALSGTGTRPYAQGADGFVMGEGAAIFLMKRLSDAERDQDKIYAVLRGIAGSSDGKGKGITAPNPIGQKLCVERAWENAGLSPATVTLIEGHGTSTKVGDVVEAQSMADILSASNLPLASVALGSVKSNIGHLKGAAGAAGILKTALALRDKMLPPSLHCEHPSPDIDFAHSPLYVNTKLKPWDVPPGMVRRAGVSAFGFGGTNFHVVMEEHMPGRLNGNGRKSIAVPAMPPTGTKDLVMNANSISPAVSSESHRGLSRKSPLRGALVIGAASDADLSERLRLVQKAAEAGQAPPVAAPTASDLSAPQRIAIDYADGADLATKAGIALKAMQANQPAFWKAIRAQGVFRGSGPAPKVAFLYTGQGSQYANMLRPLCTVEPIVGETFAEADRIMTPLLGKRLTEFIFVDPNDTQAVAKAEEHLRQTEITQPTVLTVDIGITRLLAAYGIRPDMTMGHSLGEYGALVASGALSFHDALDAVSARGRGMTQVAVADTGRMAAVFAPLAEVERILNAVTGYVVIANVNSNTQSVIGGASDAVLEASKIFLDSGYNVVELPVSHAFHTSIVAPASQPLRQMLEKLHLQSPAVPVIANVNGEFYPTGADAVPQMLDLLAKQVASPVQFVKGLRTLYDAGARVFVEVGPKKALQGFAEDVLGNYSDVVSLFTNHPKVGDVAAFNQALCGLYAAGLSCGEVKASLEIFSRPAATVSAVPSLAETPKRVAQLAPAWPDTGSTRASSNGDTYTALGHLFADVLDRGWEVYRGQKPTPKNQPVTITGAALGLPGTEHIFDDGNIARLLRGDQFITAIPSRFRDAMAHKHITRLVKSATGEATFEYITDVADVIKLAGRGNAFDLEAEFGVSGERMAALDRATALAIAAGIDALRDAGIPLVMRYKTTSKGTQLPDRWSLPEDLRDSTGVIFASAFPGYDAFAQYMSGYYAEQARYEQLATLESVRAQLVNGHGHPTLAENLDRRIADLKLVLAKEPYVFDRRFLFRVLSMGHSQFAEFIGARGPNTQINAACASTSQAITLAEDWIHAGRCQRVVVISADDVTSDNLVDWMGAGFLASGAAATDESVEDAAIPFDRRRHGLIMGMGAAALVVESAEAVRDRGIQPICEVLSGVTANSAFHGSRLDVQHICQMMESVIAQAEKSSGISRREIAPHTVFVSHETYTPARGGSASAEIHALRQVFGDAADHIVIANTKGFTGHAMATGIEEVLAVKALETGCVPPVANFKEVDPELGVLNLSKGGSYPIEYALRLGAGFGSQISMTLLRRVKTKDAVRPRPNELGYAYRIADVTAWNSWLSRVAGYPTADLEVVKRTLRIRDQWPQARVAAAAEESRAIAVAVAQTQAPVLPPGPSAVETQPAPAATFEPAAAADLAKTVAVVLAPAEAPKSEATNSVKQRILRLAVEKTGYPQDMLDLDLDLEADLGVDTVKQAEMFAAIREIYNIPRDENRKLRDYPTLAHVIRFVYENRPDLAGLTTPTPPAAITETTLPTETLNEVAPSVTIQQPEPDVSDESIKQKILEIVADKTGYPPDMLDLDLDLEADLGVDTVKQAEMFAAVRATYNIPRDENLKLRDFPTLAHVIQFARERRPKSAGATPVPAKISAAAAGGAPPSGAKAATRARPRPPLASFDAAARIPRRVPVPTLRPPISLCKPTGVTLGRGSRVVLMAGNGGTGARLIERLHAMGAEVLQLDSGLDPEGLAACLNQWTEAGPVQGVYWLAGLDYAGELAEMSVATWRQMLQVRVKSLYTTMRILSGQIAVPGTFLVSATLLGGQHGYDDSGAVVPMGGAVTGFTKSYKREHAEVLVKAVDFEVGRDATEVAGALIEETLRDPGAVEIGYKNGLRWTVGLREQPADDGTPGLILDENSVFVITGAAGSIVSAITADLAAASAGTFYLLDLVAEPDPANPDLKRFVDDKEGLKRGLFTRIQNRGERATPALVERELAALERAHAALTAIEAVRIAGGTAHYYSVNLADTDGVARVIDQVRAGSGRIDVLLHAAGVERSHFLADKDQREFDLVFDVKADGWFNLLSAIGDMPIAATVAFSSIAGRFGNGGQTDYSAANDLLCKYTSSFRTTRPQTRGIVVDWSAWGGIGMATRGSIPKMMELAGIDMLPPEAGVPYLRRELTMGGTRGEVVVAQRLGALLNEWDPTGGLDTSAFEASAALQPAQGPMVGKIRGMGLYSGLITETTLDPKAQPFLYDHRIDGTPVLPGVMGIEAFAEAALQIHPGWHIEAIEEVNFLAPFKFYRDEPRVVTMQAFFYPNGDKLTAECRLIGKRLLPNQPEPQETVHFTARVRVQKQLPEATAGTVPHLSAESIVQAAQIYRVYFHGPSYQVLQRAWWDGARMIGEMAAELPDNHQPSDRPTLMAPRLIELCLQTAGLWEMGTNGVMGLPHYIQHVLWHRAPQTSRSKLYALVTPRPELGSFDAEVVDAKGNRYVSLAGYRTSTLPNSLDAQWLKTLRSVMAPEAVTAS